MTWEAVWILCGNCYKKLADLMEVPLWMGGQEKEL
jgi:hypothetical protein